MSIASLPGATFAQENKGSGNQGNEGDKRGKTAVQDGVRPYYLVERMSDGPLKDKLKS